MRCGAPMAKSTDSRPRVISPLASSNVFPLSLQIICSSFSIFSVIRLRNFKTISARLATDVLRHNGKAA